MPKCGFKEYKRFREFLGDQGAIVLLVWLFLLPPLLLSLPFPEGAGALLGKKALGAGDWRLLLLCALHVIGTAALGFLAALATVAAGCAAVWLSALANEIEGIPGTASKICGLTWRERLGKYVDFRRFE